MPKSFCTAAQFDEARAFALDEGRRRHLTLVHPFDDAAVIAGQGTLGLEMLEQAPDLDVLVVPIGGGGLISGVAIGAKSINPNIEIVGVQTETVSGGVSTRFIA